MFYFKFIVEWVKMTEDVLIIVGIVIGVIIFFELVVATVLCVKYTKKRYGWFNCNCCTCEYDVSE